MTQLSLPNGQILDFEDASQEQISTILKKLKTDQPEIFEEKVSEEKVSEEKITFPDTRTASFEELKEFYRGRDKKEEKEIFQPTHEGEVKSHVLQFDYGQADNDTERELRLKRLFGEGTYKKVGYNDYVLLLDNISPELKEKYNLPDDGTIRVNKKGFSIYDVSRVVGHDRGALTASLGIGLLTGGWGFWYSAIAQGLAAAGGKAFDELVVEKYQGMSAQDDDQIYGDIAITGGIWTVADIATRGAFKAIRAIAKGKGPKTDPLRVEAIIAKGFSRSQAEKLAREELKTDLRVAVRAGAAPTVGEVSQKAITSRIQAIYEGIFPNQKAALKNREYVKKVMEDFGVGRITEEQAKINLKKQADAISATITDAMQKANVDEALRIANRHMNEVIGNEFDLIAQLYKPNQGLDIGFQQGLNQAARLFDQDAQILYKKSENLLEGVQLRVPDFAADSAGNVFINVEKMPAFFDGKALHEVVRNLQADKALRAAAPDTFKGGLFQYILGKENWTLSELTSLRSALRMSTKDPGIMPGLADQQVGKIIQSINGTINKRLEQLANIRATGHIDPAGPLALTDSATLKRCEEGIMAWKKADKYYKDGIQRFNNGAMQLLDKNIKEKFFIGNKPVLDHIIEPGNATKLKTYLNAITPSGLKTLGEISGANPNVFRQAARFAAEGNMKEANAVLRNAGISDDLIPKMPEFIGKLPLDDAYRIQMTTEFGQVMRDFARLATARANPLTVRNAMRDSLAKEWLGQAYRQSRRQGVFEPGNFASKFDDLGKDLQATLFGKNNANMIRELTRDYYMVGKGSNVFAEATANIIGKEATQLRSKAEAMSAIPNIGGQPSRTLAETLNGMKEVINTSKAQSDDALYKAFASGKLEDPDQLVQAILSNPKMYDRLVAEFGDSTMELAGGFKDSVMTRLIGPAFPEGITTEAVANGIWGPALRRSIDKLNTNGALSKILGQETVTDLIKVSKMGERISDAILKGKTGLAPASFAAGAGMRLVMDPLAFIREAVGVLLLGRIFRQKWFLNMLLSPDIPATLYRRGLRAGINLEGPRILGVGPRLNATFLGAREQINQSARLLGAMQLKPTGDTREKVIEGVQDIKEFIRPAVQTGIAAGRDVLREVEVDKVLGVR